MHPYPPFKPYAACFAALLLVCSFSHDGHAADSGSPKEEEWKLTSHDNGVSIFSRTHAGSAIQEFKAVGRIDCPPGVVLAVLDDVDAYPHFMPYVTECRVLKREGSSVVSYQRISPPFCTERDYSIRVRHETTSTPAGAAFLNRWEQANSLGPPEKEGVIRVTITEGSWLLEPEGGMTRATYWIYTDSGGSLPTWLANKANQIAIGKLFEAIRKQVKEAKYAAAR